MRPPKGFEDSKWPLRHRIIHTFALNMGDENKNTVLLPLVMSSLDMASDDPETIIVNPNNADYVSDTGPLVRQDSIIDRMTISLKFIMTDTAALTHETAAGVFSGEDIPAFKFLWRPIFNVYPEKLDAADEDTGTTVAAILALTKDGTFEDIVPLTTNKLVTSGAVNTPLPMSAVNDIQVLGDYNFTANTNMEDHVFDEDLLQDALRRYTNRGALRSCLGRTRHVTLTRNKPFANFYIDKPVPNAIRRVQPYGFFGIQIHLPLDTHVSQYYMNKLTGATTTHLGVKMITNFHEWHNEHDQSKLELP